MYISNLYFQLVNVNLYCYNWPGPWIANASQGASVYQNLITNVPLYKYITTEK